MNPAVTQFIAFLVADMEATPHNPTAYAQTLLDQAKAKILAGKGELGFFESSSANGKSFSRAKQLSALDVATGARSAIDQFNGTTSGGGITFLDFSRA